MNDEIDDPIDVLLRAHFEGPMPDDGFCERVMDRLPARRRRTNKPLVVGTLAGAASCWFSLRSTPIIYAGWQDWTSGEMSASAIMLFISLFGMATLALAWAIAEFDGRSVQSPRQLIRRHQAIS